MISFSEWVKIQENLRFTNTSTDEDKIMDDWNHMTGNGVMPGKAIHTLAIKYDTDAKKIKQLLWRKDPGYMKDVQTRLDMDDPINYDPQTAAA